MTNHQSQMSKLAILPVLLTFFTMGFVDLVGAASNHVQADLALTESQTYFIPSLVFFWFLIFSVPTSALMNRIGRKNTVLVSLGVTLLSLILPLFGNGYYLMLVAFSLLGIGNAIMQTSLNPLVTNLISGDKLASTLTFGQFIKAIASFMAPIIMTWGAVAAIPSFGLDWRIVFVIYGVIGVLATLFLFFTKIEEQPIEGKASGFIDCFKLLGHPFVLLCFLGIMCHVGIDVGTNTTAPKLLMERLGWTLDKAAFMEVLRRYDFSHQRRLSFEYTMFDGVNDSIDDARQLVKTLNGLSCRVNLIRFHAIPDSPLRPVPEERMVEFRDWLTGHGVFATIRASRGEDIWAACGMLSTAKNENS